MNTESRCLTLHSESLFSKRIPCVAFKVKTVRFQESFGGQSHFPDPEASGS